MRKEDFYPLIRWYQKHHRRLPWRGKNKTPYSIWVSEVMLQQTTVQAVTPYYKKFIKQFPTLKVLAQTPLKDVLPFWAGLGYYQRVKNLHQAAQAIYRTSQFPRSYKELIKLPGFGPYTARAVSSLAFEEPVGVLDGNVIRLLCRYRGWALPWWESQARGQLQKEVDRWVRFFAPSLQTKPGPLAASPSLINQALMELGALVCTSQNPSCLLCPLQAGCQALKKGLIHQLPLKKKDKAKKLWLWEPVLFLRRAGDGGDPAGSVHHLPGSQNRQTLKVALMTGHPLPVLKSYPVFPGKIARLSRPPGRYDFLHLITCHALYVRLCKKPFEARGLGRQALRYKDSSLRWVTLKDIKKQNPSSLIQKVLKSVGMAGPPPPRG